MWPCETLAQARKVSRLSLSQADQVFYVGPHSYITLDPDGALDFKTVIERHNNNLRGTKHNSQVVNLGIENVPVWMVFGFTNTTNTDDWIFHFGSLPDGRLAQTDAIKIYHSSDGVVKLLDSKKFYGGAIPITLSKGGSDLVVVRVEPNGGLAPTISPYFTSQKSYWRSLHSGLTVSHIFTVLFIVFSSVFAAYGLLRQNKQYTVIAVYFLAHAALYWALNQNFFVPYVLGTDLAKILFSLVILFSLSLTKLLFQVDQDQYRSYGALLGAGAFMVLCTVASVLFFNGPSITDDVLLFVPAVMALSIIIFLAFARIQRGQISGYYYAGCWLMVLIGFFISSLSVVGVLPSLIVFLNTYWIALFLQMPVFVLAIRAQINEEAAERRQQQSRESRAARSMERLKHSKESADQARLLRVIERERELMTELREREILRTEEMRKAKDMADEANRAKSAFLAVVSHEIRTPMTGILGMVRLLLDTRLSKEQNDYAVAIEKSGDTMMALLNDILDFEKIESGSMALEDIDFDLKKLIEGVVTLMSGHASNKGLELRSDVPDDFPHFVVGDPTRLRQVLLNLVNNAIKFTEQGHVTVRLAYAALDNPDHPDKALYDVHFAVEDTGIGISEKAQRKLFDPFAQADNTIARKYGGTGLGLAICKRLISAMGGEISVKSKTDEGSTFFFSVHMPEGQGDKAERTRGALDTAKGRVPQMHVLVVEDNEMNRKVLDAFLRKAGHKATVLDKAEKAFDLLERHQFDAIFMDINLNGIDGIKATEMIRKTEEIDSIPIVAITGNVSEKDIKLYEQAGFNGFIAKPIVPEKLYAMLQEIYEDLQQAGKYHGIPEDESTDMPEVAATKTENSPNDQKAFASLDEALSGFVKSDQDNAYDEDEKPALLKMVDDGAGLGKEVSASVVEPVMSEHDFNGDHDEYLDTGILGSFVNNLGHDQYTHLMNGFFDTALDIIDRMEDQKEIDSLHQSAHELRGMAGNFGFKALAEQAGVVEKATGKSRDEQAVENAFQKMNELRDTFEVSRAALTAWEGSLR